MGDEPKAEEAATSSAPPHETRRGIEIMHALFEKIVAHLGNHPELEALLEELREKL